ncbi:MAG: multifunctional 2',3'-cyclic-nucleotide 2'-phosphodiesterase/5'-nucleotidase/3'-nucleotidase [Herpetosiphonaceae bacterium]|nr:MAG: multifunctional 2',3'-cyclic-nucleotide 2'-phosphodiesterase/5'-nucleotidase/3'-nucleotidase [Herpetosiphonaceae bacterium]
MQLLRRFSALLALTLIITLIGFVQPTAAQDSRFILRILHTNDHHAHLEPVTVGNQKLGGIARRKTLVDQLRTDSAALGEPVLLLDAGDIFQGTLYFNQYEGLADAWFYNELGYDGAAVGNHEFDRGPEALARFIDAINFPMLSANIEVAETSPLYDKIYRWVIFDIDGQEVGVFGLTTEETTILSSPGPDVTFTNYIQAAREAVAELQAEGVNKIIAVTHIGILFDMELARSVEGIDVIVGGHSHSPVGNMPGAVGPYPVVEKAPDGRTVLVVTDWEWGKYLGDIRVVFDNSGQVVYWEGSPHPVDESITPDPTFEAKLQEFAAPLEELRNRVIGSAAVRLNGDRSDVRSKETNLGNLVADATLWKVRSTSGSGDVAIMNGGGIRASIEAGNITVGQVLEVLPFGNTIVWVDLTGAQLKQALENGVSRVEEGAGRFPQVAGMRFAYNPAAPAGSRVVDVQVRGSDGSYKPLNDSATYRVVTNNFLLNGGDGYSVFTEGQNKTDTGLLLADAVMEYIGANSPVNPQTEGRIVESTTGFGGAPLPGTGVAEVPAALPNTAETPTLPAPVLVLAVALLLMTGGVALRRVRR